MFFVQKYCNLGVGDIFKALIIYLFSFFTLLIWWPRKNLLNMAIKKPLLRFNYGNLNSTTNYEVKTENATHRRIN